MYSEENSAPFFKLLGSLETRETALKKLTGKINEEERLLDLATGSGYLVRNLVDKDAFVVCLDADSKPLIKTKNELPDLHFVVADARHLPFKSSSFDRVVTWSALVHIEHWKQVIREYVPCFRQNANRRASRGLLRPGVQGLQMHAHPS